MTEEKDPPTTMFLPTWTMAVTAPSSTCGVQPPGRDETSTGSAWLTAEAGTRGNPAVPSVRARQVRTPRFVVIDRPNVRLQRVAMNRGDARLTPAAREAAALSVALSPGHEPAVRVLRR